MLLLESPKPLTLTPKPALPFPNLPKVANGKAFCVRESNTFAKLSLSTRAEYVADACFTPSQEVMEILLLLKKDVVATEDLIRVSSRLSRT